MSEQQDILFYEKRISDISIDMPRFIDLINTYFLIDDIKTVVDLGSMDGNDSLKLKNAYPNSTVYSIEGLKSNYETYLKNLSSIVPINAVVTKYDGNIKYHEKEINGIHGIYDRGQEYGTLVHDFECFKFSTIINKYNIKNIDVLKIDVEGATLDVLESLDDYIYNVKIMHIESETYPYFNGQRLHNEVIRFLTDKDFICVCISFTQITDKGYQSDSVWVNKKFISL